MMMMMTMLSRKEEAADNDAATIGSYYAQTHPIITQHPTRDHTSSPAYHFNLTSAESHYTIFISSNRSSYSGDVLCTSTFSDFY